MRPTQLVLLGTLGLIACLGFVSYPAGATPHLRSNVRASATFKTYIPGLINGQGTDSPPLPPPTTLRIDTGSAVNFTDHAGNLWLADTGWLGGNRVERGAINIEDTNDAPLYQTERYGMSRYDFELPAAMYLVRLHFAETTYNGPGKRIFNVNVQGTAIINNLDVYAEAGGQNKALVKAVLVQVSKRLTISFSPTIENPQINAIEIIPAKGVRIDAGSHTSYLDSGNNLWQGESNAQRGASIDRGPIEIANTEDDALYRTEHWGMTGYRIPVLNGNYVVKLHFAETHPKFTTLGTRVFDVNIEGQLLQRLDVFAQAGGQYIALVKTFDVQVLDGELTIMFTPRVENPMINGIELIAKQ